MVPILIVHVDYSTWPTIIVKITIKMNNNLIQWVGRT